MSAIWFAIVAVGRKSARSWPSSVGDALLELVHRRVLAQLLVADDGRCDGRAHPRVGRVTVSERRSITAAHCACAPAPVVRSRRDRDRCRRIGRRARRRSATRSTRPRFAAPGCGPSTPGRRRAASRRRGPGLVAPVDVEPSADAAEELLRTAVAAIAGERADQVERVVVESPAGPAIIENAQDAELIVVGRRGLGAVRSIVLGSVSSTSCSTRPARCSSCRAASGEAGRFSRCCRRGSTRTYTDGMDLALLETTMSDRGEPAYRTRQVWEWAARGADGYDAMTNVPARLRDALARRGAVLDAHGRRGAAGSGRHREDALPHARRPPGRGGADALPRRSPLDLRLVPVRLPADVHVLRDRGDAVRPQPDASEILDQALHFRRLEAVDHCVFMGMGEPFLNFDNVIAAARRLPDLGITHRRTTISTVGWLPGLTRFIDEVEEPIRLALSLHAADPALGRSSCR